MLLPDGIHYCGLTFCMLLEKKVKLMNLACKTHPYSTNVTKMNYSECLNQLTSATFVVWIASKITSSTADNRTIMRVASSCSIYEGN